jgi:hypothetical protein
MLIRLVYSEQVRRSCAASLWPLGHFRTQMRTGAGGLFVLAATPIKVCRFLCTYYVAPECQQMRGCVNDATPIMNDIVHAENQSKTLGAVLCVLSTKWCKECVCVCVCVWL